MTREDVTTTDLSVPCFLVAHPKGTLLWDAGVVPDTAWKPTGAAVKHRLVLPGGGERDLTMHKALTTQLAEAGYSAADVTYLALSHYHYDHTANANAFARATWLVRQAERDAMFAEPPPAVTHPATYAALREGSTRIIDRDDFDVFGDGTVIIKSAPGHTPFHQVLYVKLAKTGGVVLSGDLYHYAAARELKRLPTFDVDQNQSALTRAAVERFLKESGAQLWIQHDFSPRRASACSSSFDHSSRRHLAFLAYSLAMWRRSRTECGDSGNHRGPGACTMDGMAATLVQAPSHGDLILAAPGALALRGLANLIAHYAPHDGMFPLRLPGTYAIRLSQMNTEPAYATLGPSLCLVAQGAKALMLGNEVFEYDPARMLVFAVDLPVSGQVTRASRREPYLGFRLDLDPARVAELTARVFPRGVPKPSENRGLYVGRATDDIIDAVTRLLTQIARPEDADLLGPLTVDEILIRLLRTPIGTRVAQIGEPKSGVHRMGEAISWIRAHFTQPITVDEMAASVRMSASSFHERFKAVTSMSPLQYQKVLRLHEARRLMLFQDMDASDACRRVGYLSPSQFSREYSRFFGSAPVKDTARLRAEGLSPPGAGR